MNFYPQLWTISEDFCWSLHSSSHPVKNSMHSICEVDWRIHPLRSSPEISQQISRFLESSPYSIPMFVQSCLNMSPYWNPNLDSEIPKVLTVKPSKFMWNPYFFGTQSWKIHGKIMAPHPLSPRTHWWNCCNRCCSCHCPPVFSTKWCCFGIGMMVWIENALALHMVLLWKILKDEDLFSENEDGFCIYEKVPFGWSIDGGDTLMLHGKGYGLVWKSGSLLLNLW